MVSVSVPLMTALNLQCSSVLCPFLLQPLKSSRLVVILPRVLEEKGEKEKKEKM